jgi:hypothetical protein
MARIVSQGVGSDRGLNAIAGQVARRSERGAGQRKEGVFSGTG